MENQNIKTKLIGLWKREEAGLQNGHQMFEFTDNACIIYKNGKFISNLYSISNTAQPMLKVEGIPLLTKQIRAINEDVLVLSDDNGWEILTYIDQKPSFWKPD